MKIGKARIFLGALTIVVGLAGCAPDAGTGIGPDPETRFSGIRITGMPYELIDYSDPDNLVASDDSIGFIVGGLNMANVMVAIIHAAQEFGPELGVPEIRQEAGSQTSSMAEGPLFINGLFTLAAALQSWRQGHGPLPESLPETTTLPIEGSHTVTIRYALVSEQETAQDPANLHARTWVRNFPADLDFYGYLNLVWSEGTPQ